MPNQPKTQHRSVRVPDDTWNAAMATAAAEGSSAGELVRGFLAWYTRQPGAKMPKRPDPGDQSASADQDGRPPR